MSARRRIRQLLGAAAIAGSPGLTACGTSVHHVSSSSTAPANTVPASASGTLRTTPAHPTTRSEIAFAFRAPVAAGVHGHDVIGYSLSVTGAGRPGCVGAREAGGPQVPAGATATITLGPSQLGAPWCAGPYSARVLELQRAHCTGSAPCPQYIRVVAIVAQTTFRVSRG